MGPQRRTAAALGHEPTVTAVAQLRTSNVHPPLRQLTRSSVAMHDAVALAVPRQIRISRPFPSNMLGLQTRLPERVAREHAVHDLQHGRHQLGLCGQQ